MNIISISLLTLFLAGLHVGSPQSCTEADIHNEQYLHQISEEIVERRRREALAAYSYNINVTNENQQHLKEVRVENAEFYKQKAQEIKDRGLPLSNDESIRRQVKFLTKIGYNVLSNEDNANLLNSIMAMQSNYAKVKICAYQNPDKCGLALEPEIEERISNSRDAEELKYYWKEWYDKAGTPTKEYFLKYLELAGKAARLNGYESPAESWIDEYEDPNFVENLENVYREILPFYKQLHAYVRYQLRQNYNDVIPDEDGNIPIHLTGNLWGQTWEGVIDLLTPFPNKPFINVTKEMIRQGYTPIKMFQMGDEFFQSLNMSKLPDSFWTESVLEKPTDGRDIICHASAWNMFSKDDVRIKQCTTVTMHELYVVHHELGHIQYYLQYQNQPYAFRRAPNPGFHEAVGDVLALSVATPKHLEKINLLKNFTLDEETRINQLFKSALKKIIFLPFAYTVDKYRWAVFRGEVNVSDYNCAFWRMRSEFSGLEPPVQRSEDDFDPPAKYHVSADVEYLRYFAAHVFEFQFLKAACKRAGQYIEGHPELTLDNCDIYDSPNAGKSFKAMLVLGSSKHWTDALEVFTGEREMNPSALLEYFQPLRSYIEAENKRLGIPVGWKKQTDKCRKK